MRKNRYDSLISQSEAADKLKRIGNRFPGFASTLLGLSEEEVILKELNKNLPILLLNLNKHKQFYENKTEYNGNILNLNREIKKCIEYLDIDKKDIPLKELRKIHFWTIEINDKYAFT